MSDWNISEPMSEEFMVHVPRSVSLVLSGIPDLKSGAPLLGCVLVVSPLMTNYRQIATQHQATLAIGAPIEMAAQIIESLIWAAEARGVTAQLTAQRDQARAANARYR